MWEETGGVHCATSPAIASDILIVNSLNDYVLRCLLLLQVPEHTWGPDVKVYLNDYTNWSNDAFAAVQGQQNYIYMTNAWTRQASYNRWALEALKEASSGPVSAVRSVQLPRPHRSDLHYHGLSWKEEESDSITVFWCSGSNRMAP